VGFHEVK